MTDNQIIKSTNPQITNTQDDILVKVDHVSKKFCRDLKTSLWYGVKDLTSEFFGRSKNGELRPKEFYAVNDVSFELRRGECLGLIGHNGAGKSTLLKMLNGLIKPDKGTITMKGRIGALIELGAGFNPLLTGRENIYINGQVLGFTRREIDEKFDAIVDFAEIGDFIDTPVQNYSSGMKVRLGFAVAAQMEPDVLLIDEVLAVGDIGFRLKCFNVISQLLSKAAVIIVSHSMPQVARVSSQILLMKSGLSNIYTENIASGIETYYRNFKSAKQNVIGDNILLEDLEVIGSLKNEKRGVIVYGDDMFINLKLNSNINIEKFVLGITFFDREQKNLASTIQKTNLKSGSNQIILKIPLIQFTSGMYSITLTFAKSISGQRSDHFLGRIDSSCEFEVVGAPDFNSSSLYFESSLEKPEKDIKRL